MERNPISDFNYPPNRADSRLIGDLIWARSSAPDQSLKNSKTESPEKQPFRSFILWRLAATFYR